jgi:hypothetical protein
MVSRKKTTGEIKYRPRFHWDARKVALLGTMSDATLAKRFRVTRTTVTNMRLKLNISAFVTQKNHKWKEADKNLLGVISDQQLGQKLGICSSQVRNMRLKLNIDAYQNKKDFPDEALGLLGVEPDKHIAKAFGMSAVLVAREREVRGIARAPHPRKGDVSLPKKAIKSIGRMLDTFVAAKYGVEVSAVRKYRKIHGIPACEDRRRTPLPLKALALLGTMSDGDLARRFGGSAALYRLRRIKEGIPSYRSEPTD